MKTLLFYLLQVIVTSGILYGYYHFALRNKRFHRYNRYYLLAVTILSITVPFLNIPVYFTQSATESSFVLETLTVISSAGTNNSIVLTHPETHSNWFTWENISQLFYILVALVVLLRIIFSVLKIRRIIRNNPVEQLDKIHFVNTDEPGTPFSFFRWLFWNKKIELHSEKGEQIFRHELFHIEQKHSWDTIFMELLTVVFWINPFFYLIRKEIKAIHEFLADQFAVSANTKWQYAELLLMQALNTNQHLVNPFFHNQIKRRIAMITTSKKPSHQYMRKMMVLPVAAIIIGLFAFSYKKKQEETFLQSSANNKTIADIIPTNSIWLEGNINLSKNESDTVAPTNITVNGKEFTVNKLSVEGADHVHIESGRLYINTTADRDTTVQPLIVLDGKKQAAEDEILKKLDPGAIEQVNVLKGPSAILKYGEMGKNGVIEIITKKVKKQDGSDNIIFDKVEVDPQFPGGALKWRQYLEKNLDASVPIKKRAPDGVYTVVVQFIVDKEGNISDVKALTNHQYGMEEEAVKVIKMGPQWLPAVQNGHPVKAYKKQAITFRIGKGDNNFPSNVTTSGNELNEIVVSGYASTAKIDNKIFDKVETPPHFPGGDTAWRRYLQRNINALVPVDSGAPAGIYKVIVQFIVNENGQISEIKSITNHGYGMEKEAIRIIEDGPGWVPAMQNGHIVRAYVQQPITFQVTEEDDQVNTNNNVLDKIYIPPSFPGGEVAFEKYIRLKQKKVKIPLQNPKVTKGLRNIAITLPVSFTVNTDGSVSDIKTSSTDKVGLGDHAIELIKNSPRWIPAFQNGKPIKATKQQPVKFVAEIDKSTNSSKTKKTQEVIYYTIKKANFTDN